MSQTLWIDPHIIEIKPRPLNPKKELCVRVVTQSPAAQNAVIGHYAGMSLDITADGIADVLFRGPVAEIGAAFGVSLFKYNEKRYGTTTPPVIPKELAASVVGIIGLETHVSMKPIGLRICVAATTAPLNSATTAPLDTATTAPLDSATTAPLDTATTAPLDTATAAPLDTARFAGYNAAKIAELYRFPPHKGAGQKIGIVQLGGSYSQADLEVYFNAHGLGTPPTVKVVLLDGAIETVEDASVEVALDVQIVAAVCPLAEITVYFAPNTMQGFYNAISQAGRSSNVVSISWGLEESRALSNAGYINSFQNLIANLGVPVFISSGDRGSAGVVGTGLHVVFPASAPAAISCGGTTLTLDAQKTAISNEVAWSGSGGGYSAFYQVPGYQAGVVAGRMRGVPDIAANADPASGYSVYTDATKWIVVGGTSAVSPLMSALFARINGSRVARVVSDNTRVVFNNTLLYSLNSSGVYRDVTSGSNGAYRTRAGWDPVTGLGVCVGSALLAAIDAPPPPPPPAPVPVPPPPPPAKKAPVLPPPPPAKKAPVLPPPPPAKKVPSVIQIPLPAKKAPVLPPPPPAKKAPVLPPPPPAKKAPVLPPPLPAKKAPVLPPPLPATKVPSVIQIPLPAPKTQKKNFYLSFY